MTPQEGPGTGPWQRITDPGDADFLVVKCAGDEYAGGHYADGGPIRPFRWDGESTTDIMPSGMVTGSVEAISDDGSVSVGWCENSSGTRYAYLWNGTSPSQIIEDAEATAINGDGTICAGVERSSGHDKVWSFAIAGSGVTDHGSPNIEWSYMVVEVSADEITVNSPDSTGYNRGLVVPL